MISDKRFLSIVLIIVFLLMVVGCFIYDYFIIPDSMLLPESDSIRFSAESGYYSSTIEVKLSSDSSIPFGAKMYYSLDGSDPSERYDKPIVLEKPDSGTQIYVLKAAVKFLGILSKSESRTYMIGDSPLGMDFISIAVDNDSLYDYDTGIFEAGAVYDENLANGAKEYVRGNYSMRGEEWTRDAQFTVIDSTGKLLISQGVGLSVAGNTSAAYEVKSLRIIGENEFTEIGKLTLDINPESVSDYSLSDNHNSLRLRSGSQDRNAGNVRSAVASRLVTQAGFSGIVGTRRAIVYLNGSFYGVFDIQQNFTESFLKQRYSLPDADNIERIESGEIGAFYVRSNLKDYFKADLSVRENREELEKHIDIDNYLIYYAAECLLGNTDWPNNNVKMWAYTGGYDGINKYTDGRYRFLIFDTDLIYYGNGNKIWFDGCTEDNLVSVMEQQYRGEGSQFPVLMKVPEYREKFLTIISDMLEGAFSRENVMKTIDEELAKIDAAYALYYSDEYNEERAGYIDLLKDAASQRDSQIREDCDIYFDCNGTYSLSISPSEGVTLSWINKTVYPSEDYRCDYLNKAAFFLTAEPSPDYEFLYFVLNGKKINADTLYISEELASDGVISLEAVCRKKSGCVLVIEMFSMRDDWIVLKNIGDEALSLDDYWISDTEDNLYGFQLPSIELAAGESFTIYCKGGKALNEYVCSFKLSTGETLCLYNSITGEMCQKVFVPNMGRNETYRRYAESNQYRFFKNGAE